MPKVEVRLQRYNFDGLVKSLQGRHSRESGNPVYSHELIELLQFGVSNRNLS